MGYTWEEYVEYLEVIRTYFRIGFFTITMVLFAWILNVVCKEETDE